jgi:hypothetical protein
MQFILKKKGKNDKSHFYTMIYHAYPLRSIELVREILYS